MCTSLSYEALDGTKFLARTMDFAFVLNGNPTFLPRDYQWINSLDKKTYKNKYGIMGTGAKYRDNYMVADGFNEYGLATAELYFAGEAEYETEPTEGAINVVSEEFILWMLGNNKTIDELRENLKNVHIIQSDKGVMGKNQPLHWVVTDVSGKTYVIEPRAGHRLELEEDPVNVMTNAPEFGWHLKNLSNFLAMKPKSYEAQTFGTYTVEPNGVNGLEVWPGSYTSPDRFVRTVFTRENMPQAANATESVNSIMHMLDGVTIPKGVKVKDNGDSDFTQYQMIMDISHRSCYFIPYGNRTVYKTDMTNDLLENQTEPKEFIVEPEQQFVDLNEEDVKA
ncbi:choloylglycine hydrolase family protein [Companilactobacillus ginsenosidimutans]|uniref:Choloylglycine hydrolase n=1 Tax=Companilactobacillus ginsenosidimutans TaxID=1007676 RepID=A0A0H4R0S7_9LACO|nr:choloylglycine hydrolase family protein [Companilactobacillus ginsenosidimutans]AKP67330.1 choloylglycine hydrolase [Companilactobacillus ginsenosidimutans]